MWRWGLDQLYLWDLPVRLDGHLLMLDPTLSHHAYLPTGQRGIELTCSFHIDQPELAAGGTWLLTRVSQESRHSCVILVAKVCHKDQDQGRLVLLDGSLCILADSDRACSLGLTG